MFCEIESNFKSVQFFFIHPVVLHLTTRLFRTLCFQNQCTFRISLVLYIYNILLFHESIFYCLFNLFRGRFENFKILPGGNLNRFCNSDPWHIFSGPIKLEVLSTSEWQKKPIAEKNGCRKYVNVAPLCRYFHGIFICHPLTICR